jgi:glutathione reductase (NADPH)
VDLITGFGSFSGLKQVTVNGIDYTADHILVAVGGKPYFPSIPGVEHCISSDGFFALEKQPETVAVVGGGYIGIELAGVFQGFGTDTHVST